MRLTFRLSQAYNILKESKINPKPRREYSHDNKLEDGEIGRKIEQGEVWTFMEGDNH